ncbi:MAG: hypothetical protein ABIG32_01840 [Candidatus Uhrbacteria bacterium]|nr:hypothetical protein [Patescibacteria group bacterium]MBU1906800.1 hypothetical protein [Patescibacteria group bacterium]
MSQIPLKVRIKYMAITLLVVTGLFILVDLIFGADLTSAEYWTGRSNIFLAIILGGTFGFLIRLWIDKNNLKKGSK